MFHTLRFPPYSSPHFTFFLNQVNTYSNTPSLNILPSDKNMKLCLKKDKITCYCVAKYSRFKITFGASFLSKHTVRKSQFVSENSIFRKILNLNFGTESHDFWECAVFEVRAFISSLNTFYWCQRRFYIEKTWGHILTPVRLG